MIRFTGLALLPACLAVFASTGSAMAWERLNNDRLAAIFGGADGNGNGNGNGNIGSSNGNGNNSNNNGNGNNGNNNGNGNSGGNNGNGNNSDNNGNFSPGNGNGNFNPGASGTLPNTAPLVPRTQAVSTLGINPFLIGTSLSLNGSMFMGTGVVFPGGAGLGWSLNGTSFGR